MARVVHFEIHAENLPRAIAFYKNVFDWKIEQWGNQEYWFVYTGKSPEAGIDGAILKRPGPNPGPDEKHPCIGYACTIDVPDVDEMVDQVERCGGKLVSAKIAIPKVGYLAYCKDTEGNVFGLMCEDTNA